MTQNTPTQSKNPAILFFDVDGTLVYRDHEAQSDESFVAAHPTEPIYEAFDKLHKAGHKAFICTGRPSCLVTGKLAELNVAGMVTSAGAAIVMDGQIVYEKLIDTQLLKQTVEMLSSVDAPILFEGSRACAVFSTSNTPLKGFEEFPVVQSFEQLANAVPSLEFCKFSFLAGVQGDAMKALEVVLPFIREHYTLCDLGIGAFEASVKGVDKGTGVREVIKLLGEPDATTYGFGDSENDLSLLQEVDVPVAMGNALDSVKKLATYVTDSVQNDGVVTGLQHFGLI